MSAAAVYRFYDKGGELLYVGVSGNLEARIQAHYREKSWAKDIDRAEFEHYADREDALAAEREAIENECPVHNRVHKNNRVEIKRSVAESRRAQGLPETIEAGRFLEELAAEVVQGGGHDGA